MRAISQVPIGTATAGPSSSNTTRRDAVAALLKLVLKSANRNPPDVRTPEGRQDWERTIAAWDVALADIPAERLLDIGSKALGQYTGDLMMTTGPVVAVWQEIREHERAA